MTRRTSWTCRFRILQGLPPTARRGVSRRSAAIALCGPMLVVLAATAANAQTPRRPDFNTDGADDLAVGVPFETHSGKALAGAVDVLLGFDQAHPNEPPAIAGLKKEGAQHWTLATTHVGMAPADGDLFGFALGPGDFNGDGASDLAIGIPGRTVDGHPRAGAVVVLYGSWFDGLIADPRSPDRVLPSQYIVQGGRIAGAPGRDERFGHALVSGDFNGDGFGDLAIGAPGGLPFLVGPQGRGEANVIYGSSVGLDPTAQAANQLWNQGALADQAEPGDWFGFSLAAGQWGNGDQDDLAIGVPGETIGNVERAGVVNVVYGSAAGLSVAGNHLLSASNFPSPSIAGAPWPDQPQFNAHFGFSLASGDLSHCCTPLEDLVIGEPYRDIDPLGGSPAQDAGAVRIVFGDADGLAAAWFTDTFTQGGDVGDYPETGDYFGYAVSVGWELFVGAPGENVWIAGQQFVNAGMVHARYVDDGTNIVVAPKVLTQTLPQGVQAGARFGSTLTDGRFGCAKDGLCPGSLVVGAPGSLTTGGVINLFNAHGPYPWQPDPAFSEGWYQDVIFANEPTEIGDLFGFSLGAGGLLGLVP